MGLGCALPCVFTYFDWYNKSQICFLQCNVVSIPAGKQNYYITLFVVSYRFITFMQMHRCQDVRSYQFTCESKAAKTWVQTYILHPTLSVAKVGKRDLTFENQNFYFFEQTDQSVTFVKILIRMNVRIYLYQQNYTNEYPNIFISICLTRTNIRISIRIENCTNI